jgi:NAD-dependent dihydropyrimidine dehydrogenase PreA subunit
LESLQLLPALLASLLLGAHFLRGGQPGLALASALFPALLLWNRRWVGLLYPVLLLAGSLEWLRATAHLVVLRRALGLPAGRLLLILGAVAAFTAASALPFRGRRLRARFAGAEGSAVASAAAFLLTAALLALVQQAVSPPMLLLERFLPGLSWLEVLALGLYAALLAEKLLDPLQVGRWRRLAWGLFSVVFFSQLALGLLGLERFLMSGALHLPVPAVILAGPVYRGELSFMVILFASTVLLVGPAWCSHLCYIGAWDSAAAQARRRPRALPRWTRAARSVAVPLVVLGALLLRVLGAGPAVAAGFGLGFGLAGVALMLLSSRRTGSMVHCLAFCPVGTVAAWLGKLSPFRIRIADGCDECGACRLRCRYDALRPEDIRRRRPASSCTLCGDCLASCRGGFLHYRCLGLQPTAARAVFVVLVTALQAASLGVARI